MVLVYHREFGALILVVAAVHQTTAFQNPAFLTSSFQRKGIYSSVRRFAKTNSKKKAKTTASGSSRGAGFGKIAAIPTAKSRITQQEQLDLDEDYSVFPALDQHVAETLVAAPISAQEEPGFLPIEIYERLDQIYGFPNFNYEIVPPEHIVEPQVSLGDLLLSSPPSASSSATTKPKQSSISDADFSNLLSAATGGDVPTDLTSGFVRDDDKGDDTTIDVSALPPFEKFRVLHVDPLVLAIDDFFTDDECDRYVDMSLSPTSKDNNNLDGPQIESFETRSKTVGKDTAAKSQRTSTTWFHHYKNVPELMVKATRLVGLNTLGQWEEPQTVRYRRNEKFSWHLDALAPAQASADLGGQRIATLLVYLRDLETGGATIFRDIVGSDGGPLRVQPKKGTALIFFPAAGGIPSTPFDIRTLHCGEVVPDSSETDKWISQLWLREGTYTPTAPPGNHQVQAKEAVESYTQAIPSWR